MEQIKLFRISCYSNCGSYFQAYLKSVDVIAHNQDEAISLTKDWLIRNGERFIYSENKWHIECVSMLDSLGVIDSINESDY